MKKKTAITVLLSLILAGSITVPVLANPDTAQQEVVELTEETGALATAEESMPEEPLQEALLPEEAFLNEEGEAAAASVSDEGGVEGFVERLYTIVLGRSSEPAGKADWVSQLRSGKTAAIKVAQGFVFSAEFKNKDLSDADFADVLYRAILGRAADAAGCANWVKQLEAGDTREYVFYGFAMSTEFTNICNAYGVNRGSLPKPVSYGKIGAFIDRLYTICLGRAADAAGRTNWVNQLAAQTKTGSEVAYGFLFSAEFTNKKTTNGGYVNTLYRALFGREPDAAGANSWAAKLNKGTSRIEVFNGFARSQEFSNLCNTYGIKRGNGVTKVGYQNPAGWPQVSSLSVTLPSYATGIHTYVTPSRISITATRSECIEAMIARAYEYMGTKYIDKYSRPPGEGVDCSGLVLQCLYATGMDLGEYNPYNHFYVPEQEYNSKLWWERETFKKVPLSSRQRGDLLFYGGHVALYLGGDMMIDTIGPNGAVAVKSIYAYADLIGCERPFQ